MNASIYEVKTNLSRFIEAVEAGGEVIVYRHKQAVARIVPVLRRQGSRIGTLAGRKYRMGEDFGNSVKNSCIADDFGVPRV
jgi:antitoxin (DNA-binding transcriptional repressor) of toxin-antitoxin stability system